MPDASKSMDQCKCAPSVGNLPESSVCGIRIVDYHFILSKDKKRERPPISVHVAYHYSELRFLYTGCSVFRPVSDGRHADDTKDMCLCMDRADWFFRYEKLIPFSAYATLIMTVICL